MVCGHTLRFYSFEIVVFVHKSRLLLLTSLLLYFLKTDASRISFCNHTNFDDFINNQFLDITTNWNYCNMHQLFLACVDFCTAKTAQKFLDKYLDLIIFWWILANRSGNLHISFSQSFFKISRIRDIFRNIYWGWIIDEINYFYLFIFTDRR